MFNLDNEFGHRVQSRLTTETIIWLTTTGRSAIPQPRPVWFYWNGEQILIYTSPEGAKVRHIRRQPKVALHFNTDERGRDVAVLHGTAVLPAAISAADHAGYLAKYGDLIKATGLEIDSNQRTPGASILITPTSLRGF